MLQSPDVNTVQVSEASRASALPQIFAPVPELPILLLPESPEPDGRRSLTCHLQCTRCHLMADAPSCERQHV